MKIPVLLIIAVILLFMVFVARLSSKLNVPLIIIALAIGIIFGSDVTGLIYFDDAIFTRDVANKQKPQQQGFSISTGCRHQQYRMLCHGTVHFFAKNNITNRAKI